MKLYKQTTEYTCAACSLLMVINHFNPDFKLTRDNEFLIWRETVNLPTRATSIYGMAAFAKKQGLSPSVIVEEREYNYPDYRFKGYTKKEIDEAKFMSKLHAKQARDAGIQIFEKELLLDDVIGVLDANKIILLRVNAGTFRDTRSTSKYLVFYKDQDKGSYVAMDPIKGSIKVTREMLSESMETLQSKKKRDHRMIVF